MRKLNNSIRFLYILTVITSISACSSTDLFPKKMEKANEVVTAKAVKTNSAIKDSEPERAPNTLSPFILSAVERVSRISGLASSDSSELVEKLKLIETKELLIIETKCKEAFDNLKPSKCDTLLLDLL